MRVLRALIAGALRALIAGALRAPGCARTIMVLRALMDSALRASGCATFPKMPCVSKVLWNQIFRLRLQISCDFHAMKISVVGGSNFDFFRDPNFFEWR